MLSLLGFEAKRDQVVSIPTGGTIKAPVLVLVGLGEATGSEDESGVAATEVRRAAGNAARAVKNAASVALCLPADGPDHVRAALEGYLLGAYRFETYLTKRSDDVPNEVVVLSAGARRQEQQDAFARAEVLVRAVSSARDWVNTPP